MIAATAGAHRAVIVGASFIGLEVAAALRKRDLEVHVVAPEACPMERTFGAEIGGFVRRLHERNGVTFHLGTTVGAIEERDVVLATGQRVAANLVVFGVGVRPAVALAHRPVWRSIAGSLSINIWRRAGPASSPPAMSRAGRIG